MPLDERTRKIRLGLILQSCVEAALRRTRFSVFVSNPKYDEDSMTPDVLIPNDVEPTHFIEVTQTEARNSFQMKTLRYFESVCEAKAYFGSQIISVNILMGDPRTELPESNVRAMYSFFDANLNPRNDCNSEDDAILLEELETAALALAEDETVPDVRSAFSTLSDEHDEAITVLAHLVGQLLENANPKTELFPMWNAERERLASLGDLTAPLPDVPAYKRPVLASLFLTDEEITELSEADALSVISLPLLRQLAGKGLLDFDRAQNQLLANVFLISEEDFVRTADYPDPRQLPTELRTRLENIGFVTMYEGVRFGDSSANRPIYVESFRVLLFNRDLLSLNPDLSALLEDSFGLELRERCKTILERDPSIQAFFQDIRDEQRRLYMAEYFLDLARGTPEDLETSVNLNLQNDFFGDIQHGRCWVADLMPLCVNESHNSFNRRMFQHPEYTLTLGNPFNNIAIRSARLGDDPQILAEYAKVATACFFEALDEYGSRFPDIGSYELALKLLKFRMDAAIKLQDLNPLHLVIESICDEEGLQFAYQGAANLLSDLSSSIQAVGRFRLFQIAAGRNTILANALYVDQYGGLDKAKEWSARGRSFLYHIVEGQIEPAPDVKMIFIADGPWRTEAIRRLRAGGWNVCRPSEFQSMLRASIAEQTSDENQD